MCCVWKLCSQIGAPLDDGFGELRLQEVEIRSCIIESVIWEIFTNGCVLCMEVMQWMGAPLDDGFRELRLQEVEKRSCIIESVI